MMTQRLDPRSDRPLALQLADLLRAEIQEGRRRPGSLRHAQIDVTMNVYTEVSDAKTLQALKRLGKQLDS
jgi:hypothetical protein